MGSKRARNPTETPQSGCKSHDNPLNVQNHPALHPRSARAQHDPCSTCRQRDESASAGQTGVGERRARHAHLQGRVDWAAQANALAGCMGWGGGRARALGAPALWLPERAFSAAPRVLHLREQHRGRVSRRKIARRWRAQVSGRVRVTGVRWMRLRERGWGGLPANAASGDAPTKGRSLTATSKNFKNWEEGVNEILC